MKRWVVKAGSQIICDGGPLLIRDWMKQVNQLTAENIEIVWVTSGAIASARERMNRRIGSTLSEKQALSALGQPMVMDLYNLSLQAVGRKGAQILLTYDDIKNRERLRNFQNSIEQLLHWQVVPVLNENDAVSTEEIRFGDNDSLSAKVAKAINADLLVILTDVDGLYDRDPKTHQDAQLRPHLARVTAAELKAVAGSKKSGAGTGGIFSKLKAAQEAQSARIPTFLTRGDRVGCLRQIAAGKLHGTWIGSKRGGKR